MAERDSTKAAEVADAYRSSDDITALPDQDLDENYEFYRATGDLEATEDEIKKVIRKIDVRVVPVLFVIYFLQYLDKNSINFANSYGLSEGTHLQGQDFSWLSTAPSGCRRFVHELIQ